MVPTITQMLTVVHIGLNGLNGRHCKHRLHVNMQGENKARECPAENLRVRH